MRAWRWLVEVLDGTPRISQKRAWDAWSREEMDRHPVERAEPWHGMEEPHFPIGERLRPGDLAKSPVFGRVLLILLLASTVSAGEPVARLAGKAGTMCAKGEKYEAVRIGKSWKALCYRDVELDDARVAVGADTSLPSSEGRVGACMTCPSVRDRLEVEMYLYYWDLNWRSGWYHGRGRWRR